MPRWWPRVVAGVPAGVLTGPNLAIAFRPRGGDDLQTTKTRRKRRQYGAVMASGTDGSKTCRASTFSGGHAHRGETLQRASHVYALEATGATSVLAVLTVLDLETDARSGCARGGGAHTRRLPAHYFRMMKHCIAQAISVATESGCTQALRLPQYESQGAGPIRFPDISQ